ncbi:MAG: radical SAM protein [Candidatus Zambryskibacteria bacterium]|nr:radical SAM protein [Candidatus Zambryskibacteria bacterium]
MKRLKVLLMKPNSESDELIPPFGLGYLATAIRGKHDVKILDGIKENLTLEKFENILQKERPDVVGLQIFTFHVIRVKDYINSIKKVLPRAKIILGGPHPSCSPQNIFEFLPKADFAFRGEAEIGLTKLLALIAENQTQGENLSGIPGLIWRSGEQTKINAPIFVEDLDELGMPSWDLIRPDKYPLAPHGGFFKNYPIAPLIITRGCPFSCTYCAGYLISGKKIRHRSVDKVIEEIKILYHDYGIREIHIEDDNFTFYHELVYEFCQKLKENNLDITWTCPNGVRLDSLDEKLLKAMKKAGLYSISVGIESGSDKILKDMRKNLTTAKIREKIKLIKDCGLEVSGFFIIGYPTETKLDIMETIKFAMSLDLKRAGFSLFKPFPGTEATQKLMEKGELKEMSDEDWAHFVLADAVYAPPGFTKTEMKVLRRRALLRFYLRPKIMFKFVSEIKSPKHFKVILKRIYSWLFAAK